jgi:predicted transcriptional regulator
MENLMTEQASDMAEATLGTFVGTTNLDHAVSIVIALIAAGSIHTPVEAALGVVMIEKTISPEITAEPETEAPTYKPAIDPKKSVKPGHIISLIDGKPYKMLRRHLATHGLTPDEYRDRYGLKPDYPMVASAYSEQRSTLAKTIGLGTNRMKPAPKKK